MRQQTNWGKVSPKASEMAKHRHATEASLSRGKPRNTTQPPSSKTLEAARLNGEQHSASTLPSAIFASSWRYSFCNSKTSTVPFLPHLMAPASLINLASGWAAIHSAAVCAANSRVSSTRRASEAATVAAIVVTDASRRRRYRVAGLCWRFWRCSLSRTRRSALGRRGRRRSCRDPLVPLNHLGCSDTATLSCFFYGWLACC